MANQITDTQDNNSVLTQLTTALELVNSLKQVVSSDISSAVSNAVAASTFIPRSSNGLMATTTNNMTPGETQFAPGATSNQNNQIAPPPATRGGAILPDNCKLYFGNYTEFLKTPIDKEDAKTFDFTKSWAPYWQGCRLYLDIICSFGPIARPKLVGRMDITSVGTIKTLCQNGRRRLKFDIVAFQNAWESLLGVPNIPIIETAAGYPTSLQDYYNSSPGFGFTWPQADGSVIDTTFGDTTITTRKNAIIRAGQRIGSGNNDDIFAPIECDEDCGGIDRIDRNDDGGGGNNPCFPDSWPLPLGRTELTEREFLNIEIPPSYTRVGETPFRPINTTTITEPIKTPNPNKPCYIGNKQTITNILGATFTYFDANCNRQHTITVTREETPGSVWINDEFDQSKRNSPECQCKEEYEIDSVLNDPADPCGCKQYNIVRVKTKCPGETEFKYSTEIYRDPQYPNIILPPGRKLDPTMPFSVRGDCQEDPVRIYHPLMLGKDIVEGKVTANTRGLFNLSQSMSCYITSSSQPTASKEYYYEVTDCDCDSTPYFAVAYGHVSGSGSLASSGETNDTSTRAIYSQYRLLALDEPERKFKFYSSGVESESEDIYAINFYRTGLSDRIDPGNFEIALRPLNGDSYANNVFTGSNVQPSGSTIYTFIDNSGDRSDLTSCTEDPYVSYDIVSGSLNNGIHSSGTGTSITTYGKFYPNLGIMVFDPAKMDSLLKFNTVTGSNIAGDNAMKLFTSISGSGVLNSHIKARNVKYKTTNHYFVRVSPPNANYSNNPTFISDLSGASSGKIRNVCFQKDPVTYVTSVGLYNNKNELLAVAKLSKPIKKTSDDDLLIKIRLNW